ncbi:DMT family transporter [Klenkia taihuensis]|uniref:DMT family transporter n=1 Tax=Klenkia taihuensis TaxID=1225127 RepID=UPI000B806718|nr:DMT family transporter [Klenkia taihuensis]
MEDTSRWSLVTAVAPVAWGSTYVVTHHVLPADQPLTGAALRALPAGLLLLALARRLPRGAWWWRSAVLGVLDVGLFFLLVYQSAQLLPSAIAATVMATSPVALTLLAWALLGQHPAPAHLVGGVVGVLGVGLLLLGDAAGVDPLGVACAVAAMVSSSVGFVLARRWSDGTDLVATTSWQLLAGGAALAVGAWVTGDGWPPVDVPTLLGFGYVTVVATALAFVCWFAGLAHLPTGTVGLVGLLNPLTGVALGCLVVGEVLGLRQWAGLALVLAGIGLGQHQRSVRARRGSSRSSTPARSAGRAG